MAKPSDIEILHEDNHILVVVKPQGLLSQEDAGGEPDLLTLLKADIKERHKKPGNVFLGLVHRLDREAGGVMVFARTSKAAARLSSQMREKRIRKTYLACVEGFPDPEAASIQHYLRKDLRTNLMRASKRKQKESVQARLDYEVIGSIGALSLVRINLVTGRQHQIRAQMTALGHPLFGDRKYNRESYKKDQHLGLWATELTFEHPTQKKDLTFRSRPPRAVPWTEFPAIWSRGR